MNLQCIVAKVDLKALCFVLAVGVASLAVVVMKKNAKIDAFRIDLAVAYERISKLETELEKQTTKQTVGDVRSALEEVSKTAASFEKDMAKLTSDLNSLLKETNELAEEQGGPFDTLLQNVRGLVQRFTQEVPEIQKNMESLAVTVGDKVSEEMHGIEQVLVPSEGGSVSETMPEGVDGTLLEDINKGK